MQILFLHPNFPAQFRHLATVLAKDPNNQVVFGTARQQGSLPGVYKAIYPEPQPAHPQTHHYVRPLETAVRQGQAVYRIAQKLKDQGFYPNIVYAHSGWGPGLFIKDIFPKTYYCCYFEWFYHARGSDADFDPSDPLDADSEARIRVKNAPILLDLTSCDQGLTPNDWQRQQFPNEFHRKLTVCHDGVDTTFFKPKPGAKLVLKSTPLSDKSKSKGFQPQAEEQTLLDLSQVDEIVTYVGRGMEPYRGFPQFMEAVALIQQRRPCCHVVVVGEDRVAYGKDLPDGKTYKQLMLETLDLDLSRLHFTGNLPYSLYLQVLQASSVHVYLTRPFVLSWSMLEAMATGCLVVGSRTAPVMEAIKDGVNGLLVDFFAPEEIASKVNEVLDHPEHLAALRVKARETILKHYDLHKLLPTHLDWLMAAYLKSS